MTAQGWVARTFYCVLALILVSDGGRADAADSPATGKAASAQGTFDPMCSDAWRSDACLRDVCFVTPQQGWAVGDRGTIWHTDNGGLQWRLQESGTSVRLESVFFGNDRRGWVAGGWSYPYTHHGRGVLLTTSDGGQHWNCDPRTFVPPLKKVRFFDGRGGWAIGSTSAMFPPGILTTNDGGRSWNPLSGERWGGWTTGDFIDPQTGAVAGVRESLAFVRRASVEASQAPASGLRSATKLQLVRPSYGVLVGQGGMILLTSDVGATWQDVPAPLPEGLAGQFDFKALAVRGSKWWIGGAPGTRIFHTPDAGRTWRAAATPQHLPLEGICFVDDEHGWAVGQLGTILATDDGGQTWTVQRAGGSRVALLGLLSEAEDVPLELLAKLSGDEGYLSVVELLNRRDLEIAPRTEVELADRACDAVVGVGGCGATVDWRFPLRQHGLYQTGQQITDGWDRIHGGRGRQALEAHLVREIRMWRPDVLVTNDLDRQGNHPARSLVAEAVLHAVAQAAESTAHEDQIEQLGLGPWQVKRVFGVMEPGMRGATELPVSQLATRLGSTLAEVASGPRGLLEDRCGATAESLGFHLIYDQLSHDSRGADFFRGIVLEPGGEARRMLLEPSPETMQHVQRIAQKQRNLRAILDRSRKTRAAPSLLAEIGRLLQDLDSDSSARILYRLADGYAASGEWPLAADVYQSLTEQYPDHPLAPPARIWLVQYFASGEAAWRVRGERRLELVRTAGPTAQPAAKENRFARAMALGQDLQRRQPELFAEPAVEFALAAADRQRGEPRQAERYYAVQVRGSGGEAWTRCARGEQWLADRSGSAPKPVATCVAASSRPHLDGRLDDEVWKRAESVSLRGRLQEEDWPSEVMLARDDQFLYVAIRCRQVPGVDYGPSAGARPRDADLSAHDRVDVLLDIDRDYVTCYRLTIDHRGWTSESCWGDATWNPTWFVAASAEDGHWTAEAAIALEELAGDLPHPNSAWAIGLQRTVPGRGFQSWSKPASIDVVPEGFGYLIFK